MEENNIIVDIYHNKYINENVLNENNRECLICFSNLLIIINYYCNCFNAVLLCNECFLTWLIRDNKCFICRELLQDNNNKIKYYNIINKRLLLKIKNRIDMTRINMISDSAYINRYEEEPESLQEIINDRVKILISLVVTLPILIYFVLVFEFKVI
mgnify:CR=1 FL=1